MLVNNSSFESLASTGKSIYDMYFSYYSVDLS